MVKIRINHHFNYHYQIIGCGCQPIEDVSTDFRKSLKPNEKPTADQAIKILRKIQIKSQIQSFFTKPVVAISLTLAVTIGGYLASALATFSLALTILGITLAVTGTVFLGIAVKSAFNGSLHKMSQAYNEKADAAQKHIQEIQAAKKNGLEIRITV